ncbi:MAG: T9SS type A sorting domain-containing protein [Flavobacteriales bacterium]|jgi:hypothetical protein|nr:T9SS type A sorting domain-containing protein [Flavobacteriales bacterium]MBK6892217.1 T9SS type A sorting domain-containing protein [Flavobacteriales bacterium]MBK7246348.1 T9SS type A sorting domain-containing protein [Flavobacteriales bacterium]MBK9597386.1 T9SS type A sorting domain-containing protein [Flavobacteriales bacterium]QQS72037.1 MAG: T9SS type A sorting domain-containing protein [Flavobacteriales bacterium]
MRNERNTQRLLLCAALGLLLSATQAQNITGYRYWFDDAIADLVTVSLSPTPVVDAQISMNSAGLAIGYHTVTVQFRDADVHWSSPYTSVFSQKGGTITALQYWFGDDAGSASTLDVTPAAEIDLTASLDASDLPLGLHNVTIRGLDDRGEWSVPYTTTMARGGGMITGYEYWIDDQVADRVMNPVGPATVVDLISDLPLNTPPGDHTFTIRFRDEAEGWSVPITTTVTVYVGIDELPGVNSLLVFPNPVQDQLTLRVDAQTFTDMEVSLLDASGRVVEAPTNWSVTGLAHRTWDTSAFPAGVYTLRIISSARAITLPFIKQ